MLSIKNDVTVQLDICLWVILTFISDTFEARIGDCLMFLSWEYNFLNLHWPKCICIKYVFAIILILLSVNHGLNIKCQETLTCLRWRSPMNHPFKATIFSSFLSWSLCFSSIFLNNIFDSRLSHILYQLLCGRQGLSSVELLHVSPDFIRTVQFLSWLN